MRAPLVPVAVAALLGVALLGPAPASGGALRVTGAVLLAVSAFLGIAGRRRAASVALLGVYAVAAGLQARHALGEREARIAACRGLLGRECLIEGEVLAVLAREESLLRVRFLARRITAGAQELVREVPLELFVRGRSRGGILPGSRLRFVAELEESVPLRNRMEEGWWWAFRRRRVLRASVNKWIQLVERRPPGRFDVRAHVERYRTRVQQMILAVEGEGAPGLLQALLLGEQADVGDGVAERFRRAGLYHMLVVSGMHVALIALLVHGLAGACGLGHRGRAAVTLAVMAGFRLFMPARPPIERALLVLAAYMGGRLLDRRAHSLNSLALALLVSLVRQPLGPFDPGFQLTFVAAASILLLAPRLELLLPGVRPRWLWQTLAVSLAAQLGVLPLSAEYFGRIPIFSLAPTLVALPLFTVSLAAGMGGVVLAGVASPLAMLLFRVSAAGAGLALRLAAPAARSGVSTRACPAFGLPLMLLYYGLLLLAAHSRSLRLVKRRTGALVVMAEVLLIGAAGGREGSPLQGRERLVIDFLDVGNGDAIVVRCPRGEVLVFDGGGLPHARRDPVRRQLRRFLLRENIRLVDHLVMSHPHPDHAGGLLPVLEDMPVGWVWMRAGEDREPDGRELLRAAQEQGVPLRLLAAPGNGGWKIEPNTRCLVFRIRYGRIAVLLTGDITAPVEELMRLNMRGFAAQVLKVPHHGSRTSSTPAWLRRVRPEVAILTTGRGNSFGHPHPETMESLTSIPSSPVILDTAREGRIQLETDGEQLWIRTSSGTRVHGRITR
jgi:competence protein ComEC